MIIINKNFSWTKGRKGDLTGGLESRQVSHQNWASCVVQLFGDGSEAHPCMTWSCFLCLARSWARSMMAPNHR